MKNFFRLLSITLSFTITISAIPASAMDYQLCYAFQTAIMNQLRFFNSAKKLTSEAQERTLTTKEQEHLKWVTKVAIIHMKDFKVSFYIPDTGNITTESVLRGDEGIAELDAEMESAVNQAKLSHPECGFERRL